MKETGNCLVTKLLRAHNWLVLLVLLLCCTLPFPSLPPSLPLSWQQYLDNQLFLFYFYVTNYSSGKCQLFIYLTCSIVLSGVVVRQLTHQSESRKRSSIYQRSNWKMGLTKIVPLKHKNYQYFIYLQIFYNSVRFFLYCQLRLSMCPIQSSARKNTQAIPRERIHIQKGP